MSAQIPFREADLPGYLETLGLLDPGEPVSVEPAGEGNINWIRRVRSVARERSFVVKQARPSLERFPEYRVSTQRIEFEARWCRTVASFDREAICPRVYLFDAQRMALVLEDLAGAEPLDRLLARGGDASGVAAALGRFLGAVHAGARDPALAARASRAAIDSARCPDPEIPPARSACGSARGCCSAGGSARGPASGCWWRRPRSACCPPPSWPVAS